MESPVCHRLHETPPGDIPGAFFIASAPLRHSRQAPPMARPVSASRPRRGLRSWLAVRWTRTPALYLTAPSSFGLLRPLGGPLRGFRRPGTQGDAGGSTKRPVERERHIPAGRGPIRRAEPAASGRKVASVAEWNPPASQGLRVVAPAAELISGTPATRGMKRGGRVTAGCSGWA